MVGLHLVSKGHRGEPQIIFLELRLNWKLSACVPFQVTQAMWSKDSYLKQIPHFSSELIKRFTEKVSTRDR
jgi:hypothetical protein